MIQNITKYLGVACLLTASVVVALIIITIFQLLLSPDSVKAVSVVNDFLSAQFPLFYSDVKGKSSEINIDPSGRFIVVCFVASISLVALSAVLNALIRGGLLLIKFEWPTVK